MEHGAMGARSGATPRRRRLRPLLALPLAALAVACAETPAPVTRLGGAGGAGANVNGNYATGRVSMPSVAVPGLRDMQEMQASSRPDATPEDRLRGSALRDEALGYGARGGLAWANKQINARLQAEARRLTATYDFSRFLIKTPGGATILPPVIAESQDTYEESDAGRTLRVADRYYQIVQQARPALTAPLWHTYLSRSYAAPEPPQEALLPKTAAEREVWRRFVAEGWEKGVEQAQAIFREDLRRLDRDFTGMVRYSELLEKKQVSMPEIAETNLGVTGSGQDMRVNDRVTRITRDPSLNVRRPGEWRAPVSDENPATAATPPGRWPGLR